MRPVEKNWIEYAWKVVASPPSHVSTCTSLGGEGLPGDSDTRFPGFIGPDFEPGRGVLCMGHVHRYLPETDDIPGGRLYDIERAISTWRTSGRTPTGDERFLTESTEAYLASAPTWDYWQKNYDKLLTQGRVPITEVAFANVAKCRTATEESSTASAKLAKACSKVYPPSELIAILKPAVILLASLRLDVGDIGEARLIQWNGRTGQDTDGNRMSTWIEVQSNRLRQARPAT